MEADPDKGDENDEAQQPSWWQRKKKGFDRYVCGVVYFRLIIGSETEHKVILNLYILFTFSEAISPSSHFCSVYASAFLLCFRIL